MDHKVKLTDEQRAAARKNINNLRALADNVSANISKSLAAEDGTDNIKSAGDALEDILEVIVGDILDEHDEKEDDIMKLATGEGYIVNGTTKLEELEDLFEIEFPDEDIDTVNGFMLYELGRLPEDEEHIQINYQGFSFIAMKWDAHMITKAKIRKLPQEMKVNA